MNDVVIIIPSYNPDSKLINLVNLKNMKIPVPIKKYCPIYSIFIKYTKKSTCSNVTNLMRQIT